MKTFNTKLLLLSCIGFWLNSHILMAQPIVVSCEQPEGPKLSFYRIKANANALPKNLSNGGIMTPKGTLRVLVIYAGFVDTGLSASDPNQYGSQNVGGWLDRPETQNQADWEAWQKTVPRYVDVATGRLNGVFAMNGSEIPTSPTAANMNSRELRDSINLSNFYYTMSGGAFRVFGECFRDPNTGKAVRINIDPNKPCIGTNGEEWDGNRADNWRECNMRVMAKIKELYGNKFNWSRFDFRKNRPNDADEYTTDNSAIVPDSVPDYIIIQYRISASWGNFPHEGMRTWPKGGGYSVLDGISPQFNMDYGTRRYKFSDDGFTFVNGEADVRNFQHLFVHELAHELYESPHYCGANKVVGDRFDLGRGIGMMNYSDVTCTALAWECWLLGWLPDANIKSYSDTQLPSGNVTLGDFLTTRQAIRIKIPNSTNPDGGSQYLWIENHAKKNKLDGKLGFKSAGKLDNLDENEPIVPIPEVPGGLYMYIEGITDKKEDSKLNPIHSPNFTNKIHSLHAGGNHDYQALDYFLKNSPGTDKDFTKRLWDNYVVNWKATKPNPTGWANDFTTPRLNYPSAIANAIKSEHNKNVDNNDMGIYYINDQNGSQGNELADLFCEERNLTWGNVAAYKPDSPVAGSSPLMFDKLGKVVGLGCNPVLIPLQTYDAQNQTYSPAQLNGISIDLVSKNSTSGEYTLNIRFNDVDINKDQRLTGNLRVVPVRNNINSMVVKSGYTLSIENSGSPNRQSKGAGGEYPDFVTPTLVSLESGASVLVEANATIRIKKGASLSIKPGSKLTILGKLIVEDGAFLCIDASSTAQLILPNISSEIIFEGQGRAGVNPLSMPTDVSNCTELCNMNTKKQGAGIVRYWDNPFPYANEITDGKTHVWDPAYNITLHKDLILKNGSKMIIPKGAKMYVPAGRKIDIYGNSELIVSKDAVFSVSSTAVITLRDTASKLNIDRDFKRVLSSTCPSITHAGLALCQMFVRLTGQNGKLITNAKPSLGLLNDGKEQLCTPDSLKAIITANGDQSINYVWFRSGYGPLGVYTPTYKPTTSGVHIVEVSSQLHNCMKASASQNIVLTPPSVLSVSEPTITSICGNSGVPEITAVVLGNAGVKCMISYSVDNRGIYDIPTYCNVKERISLDLIKNNNLSLKITGSIIQNGQKVCTRTHPNIDFTIDPLTTDSGNVLWRKDYRNTSQYADGAFPQYYLHRSKIYNDNIYTTGLQIDFGPFRTYPKGLILKSYPQSSNGSENILLGNQVTLDMVADSEDNIYMVNPDSITKFDKNRVRKWAYPVSCYMGMEIAPSGAIYVLSKNKISDIVIEKLNPNGTLLKKVSYTSSNNPIETNPYSIPTSYMILDKNENLHIACNISRQTGDSHYLFYTKDLELVSKTEYPGLKMEQIYENKVSNSVSLICNQSDTYYIPRLHSLESGSATGANNIFHQGGFDLTDKQVLTIDNQGYFYIIGKNNNSITISKHATNTGFTPWRKTFSNIESMSASGQNYKTDSKGNVYLVNNVNGKPVLYKIDGSIGNIEWTRDLSENGLEYANAELTVAKSGNIYVALNIVGGYPSGTLSKYNIQLVKVAQCMGKLKPNIIREGLDFDEAMSPQIDVLPNPFSYSTEIVINLEQNSEVSMEVLNSQGVVVSNIHNGQLSRGAHRFPFASKSVGMYFLRSSINGKRSTQKLLITGE